MKTTKKDFELFKKECKKWIKYYGLTDWDVSFFHTESETEGFLAKTVASLPAMAADIFLSKNWTDKYYSVGEIKSTAHHEVLELLFMPLHILSENRFIRDGVGS